jgi:hypothetical protein
MLRLPGDNSRCHGQSQLAPAAYSTNRRVIPLAPFRSSRGLEQSEVRVATALDRDVGEAQDGGTRAGMLAVLLVAPVAVARKAALPL